MHFENSLFFIIIFGEIIGRGKTHDFFEQTREQNNLKTQLIEDVYEFLEILITTYFKGCDVHIFHTNSNQTSKIFSDGQEDFQRHLMSEHGHWVKSSAVSIGNEKINVDSFQNSATVSSKINMSGKYSQAICHIYILEIRNSQFISSFLHSIKRSMYPTPLRLAKCILINWRAISSSFISKQGFQPTLLQDWEVWKRLQFRVEVTISHNSNKIHVLLYGPNFECKTNNTRTRNFKGNKFKLLGAYSRDGGFRNYSTGTDLFPMNKGNFCKTKLRIAIPNLSGIESHSHASNIRADIGIAIKLFRELNLLVDGYSSFILVSGATVEANEQLLDKIFDRNPMSVGITHIRNGANKYRFSFSKHYGFESLIMVYRTKVFDDDSVNTPQEVAQIMGTMSFGCMLGATCFLFLSKRYDLFSKARLPKPRRDRESWKYHDRRITLLRWLECYWEVNEYDMSFKRFPEFNLKKYAPSATIMLSFFCLFSSYKYFCVKLSTMTFIDKSATKVRFSSATEAIEAVMYGEHKSAQMDFKLVTRVHKQFWTRYMATNTGENNLNRRKYGESKMSFNMSQITKFLSVKTDEDCIEKVIQSNHNSQCYVCIGFYDAHFKKVEEKAFKNDRNKELRFQRTGLPKLASIVYDENFPWIDVFENKITRLIESGIFNLWIGKSNAEFTRTRKEYVQDRFMHTIDYRTIFLFARDLSIKSLEFALYVFFIEVFVAKRKLIWKIIKNLMKYLSLFLAWFTRNCFDWSD